MNINDVIHNISKDQMKSSFNKLYGENVYEIQKERYLTLIEKFRMKFQSSDIQIISSPGRTELGGNHTDHNHGRVLAASIQLDTLAVVSKNSNNMIKIYSEGFSDHFIIDLKRLDTPTDDQNATSSLIRGIAAIFQRDNMAIGGFNAYVTSDVLIGSGLSSSASFEILIGKILSVLFNKDTVSSVSLAKMGQRAENEYLNKPCGLMDQVACAYGGIVAIDFKDPEAPVIDEINYSFEEHGYKLLVIDTGGDHADLTADYAAIPEEMKNVAKFFGHEVCRSINTAELMNKIPEIVNSLGDRAVLRALHFLKEDERVVEMVDKLKNDKVKSYLEIVQKSGDSSFKFLQNVFTSKHVTDQKISLAIALTESYKDFKGAVRVHGGGFAGTVQVYIESEKYNDYKNYIEGFFGSQSVTPLRIRESGSVVII